MSERRPVRALVVPVGEDPAYITTIEANLESISALVGGNIEAVTLGADAVMYINEDGKYLRLPVNGHATRMLAVSDTPLGLTGDFIAGPAVIFGVFDKQGRNDGYEHDTPESVLDLARRAGVGIANHPHA